MADDKIVEDVERVEIAAEAADPADAPEDAPEDDGTSPEATSDEEPDNTITPEPTENTPEPQNIDPKKPLAGETPREFALRKELEKTRDLLRKEQGAELHKGSPVIVKKELDPEKRKILEKYKPDEIENLKEVFGVLAEDMGFVKGDELKATTYEQVANDVFDDFMTKHPEYSKRNDKDGLLWNQFKEEHKLFQKPADPRDYKKIFERIHNTIFKPATGNLNAIKAAKEKVKVASHAGPSSSGETVRGRSNANAGASGLRTDMLKGFSAEEIADMTGE